MTLLFHPVRAHDHRRHRHHHDLGLDLLYHHLDRRDLRDGVTGHLGLCLLVLVDGSVAAP